MKISRVGNIKIETMRYGGGYVMEVTKEEAGKVIGLKDVYDSTREAAEDRHRQEVAGWKTALRDRD